MHVIVADIISLEQYLRTRHQILENHLKKSCLACGKIGLWAHGSYERKPDRSPEGTLNPMTILRFMCPHCGKTHSLLPECIPPRRWYPWFTQQAVLIWLLAGNGLRFVSETLGPARSTCRRWWGSLKDKFLPQSTALRTLISDLGRYAHFEDFWQACLTLMPLGKAMRLCYEQGVQIP